MNLMRDFMASREKLTGDWRIKYDDSENLPFLEISDLPVIAGFTGYVKTQSRKIRKKVFYRGQPKDWDLIPSLFRDDDNIVLDDHRIAQRLSAYKELVKETKLKYKNVGRFQVADIDPILQHYGIRTPWIDLVDNIFVAIWFAIHKFEKESNGISRCKPSSEKFGWIYYFQVSDDIKYYDLRENYISLSL